MANSKANIYPVQLQNAELNLNKYDAEIKSYNGFNKNNAPFVGGCLSNLFIKNETMAGDAAGTYIDLEGNIWTLDDYGFLKNGEPFGERSEDPLEFWDIEEKQMPAENIIYYYNDSVYVTKEYSGEFTIYTIHIGEYEESISAGTDVYFESFDIDYSSRNWLVGYKYYKYSQANYKTQVTVGGFSLDENADVPVIMPLHTGSSDDTPFTYSFLGSWVNYSDVCIKGAGRQRCILAVNDCENFDNSDVDDSGFDDCFVFQFGMKFYDDENIGYYKSSSITEFFGDISYKDFANWFFTKNYAYFFPVKVFNEANDSSSGYLYPMKVTYDYYTSGVIVIVNEYNKFTFFAYNSSFLPVHFSKPEIKNCILKSYGIMYTLDNFKSDLTRSMLGVCDYYSQAVTVKINKANFLHMIAFNSGGLVNSCLLTNNMLPSGLSLPGGFILTTEWNSVDKDHLYFSKHFNDSSNVDDNFVIYKDINQNKWFRLFRTTTKKLVNQNGQLVSNFNRLKNAIRLSDGENLTFAPAWNNRYPFATKYVYASPGDNGAYFASAINEYSIKDNASIILNPIPVIDISINYTVKQLISKQYNMTGINFYSGEDATKCNYFFSAINNAALNTYSGNKIIFLDANYITDVSQSEYTGFPFPIDSNGNVQYSPSLFSEFFSSFGNDVFIKTGRNAYQLMKSGSESVMSFYLGTLVEGLDAVFVLQGQYYGIINDQIFSFNFSGGVVQGMTSVVNIQGLQYCGNTPYEALFFSATNRCLYSFTGANLMSVKQFIDKISVVRNYQYNPATQSIFLLTDIGVIVSSLFGVYQIDFDASKIFLLLNGVVFSDNDGNYRYIKYYQDDIADGYTKENINIETCFFGSDNQTVTINDCLYMRLFSENSEAGSIEIAATTISNEGKTTEKTTIKIKSSDWDKETNSIYLRYQPQEQRGLGISFKINSPFKIASLSVGSIPDAILVDKVSKNSINAPMVQSNTNEW